MIHFLPLPDECEPSAAHGELLSRVAGLKRALRLVDPFGGGPASDFDDELDAAAFAGISDAAAICFDTRSQRVVGAAAAGLEAVVGARSSGTEPNDVSLDLLAREIRAGLADLSSLVRA